MVDRSSSHARIAHQPLQIRLSSSVSVTLSLIFSILSIVLLFNLAKTVSTAYQRSQLLAQAEQEVDELRMRNLELREKLDYVSDDEYVEQEARDQLQYSKDGETMVLLPDTLENSGTSGESLGETTSMDEELVNKVGWERWRDLLFEGV